jgi:phospholipid/cholesterol/gamma-HCH transport system ATP-binding protein
MMMKVSNHNLPNEIAIEISDLSKSFGNQHVLINMHLNLYKGENLAVLGKSGSGKSVLLKCIVGLVEPEKGNIKVLGKDVLGLAQSEMDKIRMKIGFLFQSNALYDSMTVRENLEFPLRRHGLKYTKKEVDDMVSEALSNVGLPDTATKMPAELSGGMKKRIALARTLMMRPDIILYDEPTTGLDPITSREISNLIVSVQEKYQSSAIIITHDINCVKIVADRIIMLIDGYAYAEGSYSELAKSNDPKIKSFFE